MTDTAAPPLYPLSLRLEGEKCLVVGGGRIAARKIASLVTCGAEVTVIAPATLPEVNVLAGEVRRRPYRRGDAAGFRLVIAATGDAAVDQDVFEDAEAHRVLVNAADQPAACRFLVPAVLRRGPVSVAVSTGGASPYLATWLRDRIAATSGPELEEVAALLSEVRASLRSLGLSTEGLPWADLVDDELLAEVAAGRIDHARARAARWLADRESAPETAPRENEVSRS
jgi:precorrin-2 dehydrogenase/sirohydrochlorin ferrochelatase